MTRHCDHYDDDDDNHHTLLIRCIKYIIIILISILILTIFLIWIILRPTKPEFSLQEATLYCFNITQPYTLTTNFQVTISSLNPNEKIGIYYERANIYASYRNQPITTSTSLPTTYQGHKEVVMWSPYLNGQYVPIDMNLGMLLQQDRYAGIVFIDVKINGIVKWKVGSWVSGKYHLNVNCPAYVSFIKNNNKGSGSDSGDGDGNNNVGVIIFDPVVKFHHSSECQVDV